MHLLFPSDPFDKRVPDAEYADEYRAMQEAGLACSLFSSLDFDQGVFKLWQPWPDGEPVLYRGWMLTVGDYARLCEAIRAKGGISVTTPEQYRLCHHLPEWYQQCEGFTPETIFVSRDADFAAAVSGHAWPAYFVKDYVKSLTTMRGSVAATAAEIGEIVQLIEQYRGQIEGGVCIRKYEQLKPDTEERYFVFRGQGYSREGEVPDIVRSLAGLIESPFFSVDIVEATEGGPRLIELGDGQVSSRKKWPLEAFVSLMAKGV